MIKPRSVLVRIDPSLEREIKKFQSKLEFETGRKISFSVASQRWLKQMKRSEFDLIKF